MYTFRHVHIPQLFETEMQTCKTALRWKPIVNTAEFLGLKIITVIMRPRRAETSFRFCHRQGHFLYHSRALSELTRYTLPRSHAPFWQAYQPVVKVAEDQPRVMFKGLRRAGKPPNQLGASICPCPLIFEQADCRTGRDSRHMPQDH